MTARRCCTSSTTSRATNCSRSPRTSCSTTAIGILNLQERQRIALFVRRDPLERFVSCLVYVPRDRYDTRLAASASPAFWNEAFAGTVTDFSHSFRRIRSLARVQFIVRVTRGRGAAGRDRRARTAACRSAGAPGRTGSRKLPPRPSAKMAARERLRRLQAFPVGYQARTTPEQAIADLDRIDGGARRRAARSLAAPARGPPRPRRSAALPAGRAGGPVRHAADPRKPRPAHHRRGAVPHRKRQTGRAVWVHEFTLGDRLPCRASPGRGAQPLRGGAGRGLDRRDRE